jgi:Arc/MetJ family transcription regulator
VIFRSVGDERPYPDHGLHQRDWAAIPPRQLRLDELVTTKRVLALDVLLDEDSTFYGDLFPHVVQFQDVLYLEDGLHRAVRAALAQRNSIHARVHQIEPAAGGGDLAAGAVANGAAPAAAADKAAAGGGTAAEGDVESAPARSSKSGRSAGSRSVSARSGRSGRSGRAGAGGAGAGGSSGRLADRQFSVR